LRGAAVVLVDGEVVLEQASGIADVETGEACTPDTRFPIASVSKQMAAVAVLLLAERGALALDEPVSRWLPHTTPRWGEVTLHHLLTQTAGIGHWGEAPGYDVFAPMDIDERVTLIQQGPLHSRPGTEWRYSSPGYLLVGHIVERVAGRPYHAFLAEEVLDALGLGSTVAGCVPAGAARGHNDGKPVPAGDFTAMPGTGDVWSTAEDLARYTAAIHKGSILSETSLALLTKAHVSAQGGPGTEWMTSGSYGYGVFLGTVAGAPAVYHTGDNPGYKSMNVWLPERAASIAILANDGATELDLVLEELHHTAFGGSVA
jgi:CubicO group peptidase (beta-lactamase class C family)